jgi:hypothetical protein
LAKQTQNPVASLIVPDNLENPYQGGIAGVCKFGPWK